MLSSCTILSHSCDKEMETTNKQPAPYFLGVIKNLEKHCNDLDLRKQLLTDKIMTIEKSLPALLAISMSMSATDCKNPPFCKIRQLINELSQYPDPDDKRIKDLRSITFSLNQETEELHEKIITTDIELEEKKMELEILILSNEELLHKIMDLEKELDRHTVPSLHSIHSEDLTYINKIRQLGEHEIELKCQMKKLEEKEVLLKERIQRLLESKNSQKTCSKKEICQQEKNSLKPCVCLTAKKYNLKCKGESCVAAYKKINPYDHLGKSQTRACASMNFGCMKMSLDVDYKTPCVFSSHYMATNPKRNCNSFGYDIHIKSKCTKCPIDGKSAPFVSDCNNDEEYCDCEDFSNPQQADSKNNEISKEIRKNNEFQNLEQFDKNTESHQFTPERTELIGKDNFKDSDLEGFETSEEF